MDKPAPSESFATMIAREQQEIRGRMRAQLDQVTRQARELENRLRIEDAEKRAEKSRIKLGVAALFGLRNV